MTHHDPTPATAIQPASLGDLARYFLWLGLTAFGGPAAHIALMQEDLVSRRRWLTRQQFLDMLAATQVVPGPNSTEMAIHVGYAKQGLRGLVLAGACFILPAFLIVLLISMAYVAYGRLPAVGALFYGIQPVIVAIIVQAIERLLRTAWKLPWHWMLGIATLALGLLLPLDPVWIILAGGLVGVLVTIGWPGRMAALGCLPLLQPFASTAAQPGAPLWELALFFLKVGATLMGSGYLLITYLQNDLVRAGWLTQRQVLDAVVVGQMTPGPVFTTAAFVGYLARVEAGGTYDLTQGVLGAAVCALAIFLPSFLIVAATAPLIPRMRTSRVPGAFLDGVSAAVVGSMAATTITLLRAATTELAMPVFAVPLAGMLIDLPALLIFLVATVILLPKRAPNSTWLIAAGGLVGLVVQAIH